MLYKTAYVYVHINKITGKAYVGQTTVDPLKRFGKNGAGYKNSPKFYAAILEYGWQNFEHIIKALHNVSRDDINMAEQVLIDKYNSLIDGYNSTSGGSGDKMIAKFSSLARGSHLLRKGYLEIFDLKGKTVFYFKSLDEVKKYKASFSGLHIIINNRKYYWRLVSKPKVISL